MDSKTSTRKSILDSTTSSSKTGLPAEAASTSQKIKAREDAAQVASERRRIWAMAAASTAEMIKELRERPAPQFDDVTKVFAPITPGEWADKRKGLEALRDPALEAEEITDAQLAEDLFYDPDATDDDLGTFLGPSDADLKEIYRGSSSHVGGKAKLRQSKMDAHRRVSAPKEKSTGELKRSSDKDAARGSLHPQRTSIISQESQIQAVPGATESLQVLSTQNMRHSTDEERRVGEPSLDIQRKASSIQQSVGNSTEDVYYGYEERDKEEGMELIGDNVDENEVEMYQAAEVNLNVDEALVGLENLLDDLRLESRITERFKYKLTNKYSLLLQALITYQEREHEIISHLQTKNKIMKALHQFVKNEAEAAAKAVIAEEEKEEDKEEGQVLDLVGKHDGEGGEDAEKKGKDSQGLSIEEMPAATIRETLLQQKNRLDVLESIKKVHALQLKQLEFERTLLSLHYSRMVKPSDLSKEIKDGRRFVNDLQLEISSIHQEMGQIQNEIRIQEKQVIEEEKAVEKLEVEALTKQGEVQVLANKPVHIAKEADREAQKLEQYQDVHDNLCLRYMDGMEVYRTNQKKIDVLTSELNNLTKTETKLQQQKKTYQRECDIIFSQMETMSTREHMMMDKGTALSDRIQQVTKQKKRIVEEQHRMFNEANKSLREAQKLERSIRMSSDAFYNAKLAYDKMRVAFDAAKPSDQNSNWEKLSRMLKREIVNLKAALDKKLDEANYKSEMVAKLQARLNDLYEQQVSSGKDLQDLIRATMRKRREREEKSEQCIKLEAQIQRILLDKKSREIAINDCLRSEKLIFKQLSKMQKLFNQLKTEKSAIVNELSSSRQTLQKAKAKIDEVNMKLNAYLTQTQMFESMIKEKYYVILNARIKRDSIKSDAMRSRQKFRFHRNQKMELLLNNKTLRREAEKQKKESIVIRKDFEKATNAADEFAVNVRIRTEEICTFHEYIYCYQKILLRGSEAITVREMEKSKLNSLYEETRKHVFIVQMNQPDEKQYFNKIERLREQFYEVTQLRRDLETKLNEDDNPARVREIDFEKLKERENMEVLEKRLDAREENLATRDIIGLEKTLMENHLTKITEDSLDQALYLKDFYGDQVKAIVNIRRNLNNLYQQIDGFICETAIASAQADIAEKHFNHCQIVLQNSEQRWANGLPPTDEMEEEYNRNIWRKTMLKKAQKCSQRQGFLRDVKPLNGSQIQANKWQLNRRSLEKPEESVLGWSFSAISDPIVTRNQRNKSRGTLKKN